jgi:hypothetical protein
MIKPLRRSGVDKETVIARRTEHTFMRKSTRRERTVGVLKRD